MEQLRAIRKEQHSSGNGVSVPELAASGNGRRYEGVTAVVSAGGTAPRLPAGTRSRRLVTVLFVDIVGSTNWISLLGDQRWVDLQEEHEAIVRDAIRRFRGTHLLPTGDGFVVMFTDCMSALLAARAIVENTRRLGIDVRAALHSGECEIRGRKAAGIVFHICARIMALADAGEILVSRAVREVALASPVTFVERGRYALRGLPGEWEVYQAQDGGPDEAPVARAEATRYSDRYGTTFATRITQMPQRRELEAGASCGQQV